MLLCIAAYSSLIAQAASPYLQPEKDFEASANPFGLAKGVPPIRIPLHRHYQPCYDSTCSTPTDFSDCASIDMSDDEDDKRCLLECLLKPSQQSLKCSKTRNAEARTDASSRKSNSRKGIASSKPRSPAKYRALSLLKSCLKRAAPGLMTPTVSADFGFIDFDVPPELEKPPTPAKVHFSFQNTSDALPLDATTDEETSIPSSPCTWNKERKVASCSLIRPSIGSIMPAETEDADTSPLESDETCLVYSPSNEPSIGALDFNYRAFAQERLWALIKTGVNETLSNLASGLPADLKQLQSPDFQELAVANIHLRSSPAIRYLAAGNVPLVLTKMLKNMLKALGSNDDLTTLLILDECYPDLFTSTSPALATTIEAYVEKSEFTFILHLLGRCNDSAKIKALTSVLAAHLPVGALCALIKDTLPKSQHPPYMQMSLQAMAVKEGKLTPVSMTLKGFVTLLRWCVESNMIEPFAILYAAAPQAPFWLTREAPIHHCLFQLALKNNNVEAAKEILAFNGDLARCASSGGLSLNNNVVEAGNSDIENMCQCENLGPRAQTQTKSTGYFVC
jgi:hypothetical protein